MTVLRAPHVGWDVIRGTVPKRDTARETHPADCAKIVCDAPWIRQRRDESPRPCDSGLGFGTMPGLDVVQVR
ncbi:hypothetical protein PAXINDRAFT_173158 [Paxillus involutus ATCC 200175]|uniref:Uncharacterized protein n=1 Tax=Paxillus involutus ATCC 200175 TaxID=664439 RepID=A0A0C9SNI2_PAXIN|nr:hypothetical protein PAXINDRAFT_173158 [Paxillus involutus ATCC 200175]